MSTASFIVRHEDRLSLRIPGSAWKASGQRAAAAMAEQGMRIRGELVRDWRVQDMREEGAWVLVSGPAFNGYSLEEALASGLGKAAALERLAALASALRLLSGLGRLPERLFEQGILFAPDGELLILPAALTASACAAQSPDAFLAFGGGPERGAAALIESMLRRICSQGREDAPSGIALALLEPSLDSALTSLSDREAKAARPSLDEWRDAFETAAARGFFRAIGEAEAIDTGIKLEAELASLRRRDARTRFFKRRGGLLAGIAIGLAAALAIILLSRSSPGPDYSGLDAPDLLAAYYNALDSLDMIGLDACVSGSAGKDDRNFVGNLTVIRKMRQAYGEADAFINAKDWLGQGSPVLAEGSVVFGISELSIREMPLGDSPASAAPSSPGVAGESINERRFEVRYAIWSSYSADESYRVIRNERIDTLSLKWSKRGWKIYRIERISR